MSLRNDPASAPRGQILVIVAAGMVVLVALVGLVIDAGFAWGRQRDTQNAADAASLAGATVMAERLAGAIPTRTDTDVDTAVNLAFTNNEVTRDAAFYTDITGQLVTPGGAVTTSEAAAAEVGDGSIPSTAAGVVARGTETFDTFLMRIMGFETSTVFAPATAVAGYLNEVCAASSGCDVIPITVPVTILQCNNTGNDPVAFEPPTFWQVTNEPISIPLCGNDPGNIGWIDTHYPLWVPRVLTPVIGTFLLRQFFKTLPRDLEDAAKLDGASAFRIFWNIMLPQVKPGLAAVGVFTFLDSWNDLFGPLIFINSVEKQTLPVALALYRGEFFTQTSLLMAGATITVVPVILLFISSQKYFIRGITMTGLKG